MFAVLYGDVAPEAWLTPDGCYLVGWKQKKHGGDHGLNEHAHSDGDHRQYDTLGFNAAAPLTVITAVFTVSGAAA